MDYNRVSNLCERFDENVSLVTCCCVVYQTLFVLFYFLHIIKHVIFLHKRMQFS